MAKKATVKAAQKKTPVSTGAVSEAQAILQLAEAIKALADAIAQHPRSGQPVPATFSGQSAPSATTLFTAHAAASDALLSQHFAFPSRAEIRSLPPLTDDEILAGIRAIFNASNLTLDSNLSKVIPGGPARVVAMWKAIDEYPPFRRRGLSLGPNELRPIATVHELVGVIVWGLRNAWLR